MQKPCRARLWVQHQTYGLKLDISAQCTLACVVTHRSSLTCDIYMAQDHSDTINPGKVRNFQKLISENNLKILRMHWEVKKSKCKNRIKCGSKICKMRGFQIWPQNSNRIPFHPLLDQKAVKSRDFLRIFKKILDLTVFRLKRGSNVIRFEL